MTAEEKAQKFGCVLELDHMLEDLAMSWDMLRKAGCSAYFLYTERFIIPPLPGYKLDTSCFSQQGHSLSVLCSLVKLSSICVGREQ